MFFLPPDHVIAWLGYRSTGHFFHHLFTTPPANEARLHPPCPKTLDKYLKEGNSAEGSHQFKRFIQRQLDYLESRGIDPELFKPSDQPILRNQFPVRELWPKMVMGLKLTGSYPYTCEQAEQLLAKLQRLMDSLGCLDDKTRYQVFVDDSWIRTSMTELGMSSFVNSICVNDRPVDEQPQLCALIHFLNIFCLLKVLAALDAEINNDVVPEHRRSLFADLMPSLPLQNWHPHRKGILDRYLGCFETKEAAYAACTTNNNPDQPNFDSKGWDKDSVKVSLIEFCAGRRNIKWKTARDFFEHMLDELSKHHELDRDEVLGLTHIKWCVADILCGWISEMAGKHARLKSGMKGYFDYLAITNPEGEFRPWSEQELVDCFAHYPSFYQHAMASSGGL